MGRFVVNTAAVAAIPSEPSVDQAMNNLANEILTDAQARVPVKTGALRESGFVDGRSSEYRIGFTKDYAGYVEFGTDDTQAQPYLTPAALQDRGRQ